MGGWGGGMIKFPKLVIRPGSYGRGPWALLANRLLETIGLNEFFCPLKVGWSEDRYNHIVGKLRHFLKQAGFKVG